MNNLRQPKGQPTGGQFAANQKSEPNVTLAAPNTSISADSALEEWNRANEKRSHYLSKYRAAESAKSEAAARYFAAKILEADPTADTLEFTIDEYNSEDRIDIAYWRVLDSDGNDSTSTTIDDEGQVWGPGGNHPVLVEHDLASISDSLDFYRQNFEPVREGGQRIFRLKLNDWAMKRD